MNNRAGGVMFDLRMPQDRLQGLIRDALEVFMQFQKR
jgi:hypothetical protein